MSKRKNRKRYSKGTRQDYTKGGRVGYREGDEVEERKSSIGAEYNKIEHLNNR
jgi:hypothetical protein